MTDAEAEAVVKAATRLLMGAVLGVLDGDGHVYGTRPCDTCRFVTSMRGEPFGCVRIAARRRVTP